MTGLSTIAFCLAGIGFFMGLWYALFSIRIPRRRDFLAFAFSCISIGFYDLFCAGLYTATSPDVGAIWQRLQSIALAGTGAFLLWFSAELTSCPARRLHRWLYLYFFLQILALCFDHSGFTWSNRPMVREFDFFGTHVIYNEVAPGILVTVQSLITLLAAIHILRSLIRHQDTPEGHKVRPLIIGLAILFAAAINDTFVAEGIYDFIYTIEYAAVFVMLSVAYSLTRTFLETQEALTLSESRFRILVNSVPDLIYSVDHAGTILSINQASRTLLGIEPDDMIGQPFIRYVHPQDQEMARKLFMNAVATGLPAASGAIMLRVVRRDGAMRWVSLSSATTFREDGSLVNVQGVIRDVTDTKDTVEQLGRLAAAVEAAEESIVITDAKGNIQYVNPHFELMTGYTRVEALGNTPRILASGKQDKAFYADLWATILEGRTWRGHFSNRRKDGTIFEEDAVISPVRDASTGQITNFVAVKRDVTHQLALESQLRHSQTMEAIGRLSRGVAHDFTNMLVVIMNSAMFVRKRLNPMPPDIQEFLDNIITASNKAADLTGQLLSFSHE